MIKIKTALAVYKNYGILEFFSLIKSKFFAVNNRIEYDLGKNFFDSKFSISSEIYDYDFIKNYLNFSVSSSKSSFSQKVYLPDMERDRGDFFSSKYDLGELLSHFIFNLILETKPLLILETGVAAGKSSSIILSALNENGVGKLVSVDIAKNVGGLIPENIKTKWKFYRIKRPRKVNFRKILKTFQNQINIFLHDSNHQTKWQIFEIENVLSFSPNISFLLIDDITPELYQHISIHYPHFKVLILKEKFKFSCIAFSNL